MNSLTQFKGTASFSRSVDCENAERFIFKAVCGPVFAVSARSRGDLRRPIADRLDNLLDCVNHQLRFLTLNIVPAFCCDYVFGIWRKCRQRVLPRVPCLVECCGKIGGQRLQWAEVERLTCRQNKKWNRAKRLCGSGFFDLIEAGI
jgi:hypothetical protein